MGEGCRPGCIEEYYLQQLNVNIQSKQNVVFRYLYITFNNIRLVVLEKSNCTAYLYNYKVKRILSFDFISASYFYILCIHAYKIIQPDTTYIHLVSDIYTIVFLLLIFTFFFFIKNIIDIYIFFSYLCCCEMVVTGCHLIPKSI